MLAKPEQAVTVRGRLLAVGDIHGCLDHLQRLIARVEPTESDRLVFLGDSIDRGPDGKGVLDYLLDFGRRFPNSVFLKGNHEAMFLDFLSGRNQMLFIYNGGDTTLESYLEAAGVHIPKAHLDFLEALQPSFATEDFIFVHAGLRPGRSLAKQDERDLLWIRDEFIDSDYDWGQTVVFGHTPLQEPFFSKNKIGLDTGAVYGRVLTCCDVQRKVCWNSAPLVPA
ncbi:MAG TPA: metallophosphoesterase family protein [Desulfuromonadales bacterium]